MTNQEVLVEKRRSFLNMIIFGIGCFGLLLYFFIAIIKGKPDLFILLLDLLFSVGFGMFSYRYFENYKILKKFKTYGKIQ
jgi:hypothetical protein